MLLTAFCRKHNHSIFLPLWILQICSIYSAIAGPISNTTQLHKIQLYDVTINTSLINSTLAKNYTSGNHTRARLIPVVTVDIKSLYKAKEFRKEKVNLILLPGLALVCFITMVCFRVCEWKREDMKFKTRGCSYDVTNYVILSQGDPGFDDVEIASNYDTISSFASVFQKNVYKTYDTITSYKSLQYRIDSRMFTQTSSYNTYLKSPIKKTGNFDFDVRIPQSDVVKNGKDAVKLKSSKENMTKKEQVSRKIPGTRFSIVPALDNYVRLKREGFQRRSTTSSPNTPSDDTGDVSSPGTPTSPRKNNRHRVSFTERSRMRENDLPMKSILMCNKCDKQIQVSLPGKRRKDYKKTAFSSKDNRTSCDKSDEIEMTDLSAKKKEHADPSLAQKCSETTDIIIRDDKAMNDSKKQVNAPRPECRIVVHADVHSQRKLIHRENQVEETENCSIPISNGCILENGIIPSIECRSESENFEKGCNDEGFTHVHLQTPTSNGFIKDTKNTKSEYGLNVINNGAQMHAVGLKRPRSLSPLHHVKISPKDVHIADSYDTSKRKFSLGALPWTSNNNKETFLSGRKSISSIRDLLWFASKPERQASKSGDCDSSDSFSLLSNEEIVHNDIEGSNESLIISDT